MTDNNAQPPPSSPAPVLSRVVSDALFGGQEVIIWAINAPHPIVPDAYKVIRMFIDLGGVEIYSLSIDNKKGMRNIIPTSKIRFTEEAMPLNVFGDELYAAEFAAAPVGPLSVDNDDDDDDDDDGDGSSDAPDPDPDDAPVQPPS